MENELDKLLQSRGPGLSVLIYGLGHLSRDSGFLSCNLGVMSTVIEVKLRFGCLNGGLGVLFLLWPSYSDVFTGFQRQEFPMIFHGKLMYIDVYLSARVRRATSFGPKRSLFIFVC